MKKQLLTFAMAVIFLKSLFICQSASAQNSRVWGTYFGGKGRDYAFSTATDAAGNVFMAGITEPENSGDTNYTSTHLGWNGFLDSRNVWSTGLDEPYLVKFDASGNRLWATYYGDQGCPSVMGYDVTPSNNSVATDAAGNVYLGGTTYSTTGIASNGFMNIMSGVGAAAYLAKFDANGNRIWGTYYYGAAGTTTVGNSVATDIAGNVYLAGWTTSTTGIAAGGFQNTLSGSGNTNCFLVKFDSSGNRLWATYYGGNGGYDETAVNGIATDAAGNVYLVGNTNSSSGIAAGGFKNTFGAYSSCAFLVKFDYNGNRLWGTYYGNATQGNGVAADAAGNVYMTGAVAIEQGDSGIATPGSFQDTSSFASSFLVKFDSNGNRLWGTYYYGSTSGFSVAAKGDNVWMGGLADPSRDQSGNGINISYNGFRDSCGGPTNIYVEFVVKFDADGNRQCATYYSGQNSMGCGSEFAMSAPIAVDNGGNNVYLVGNTADTSGIASPGAFQDTLNGSIFTYYKYVWDGINHVFIWTPILDHQGDSFLVKFTSCVSASPVANFQSSDSTFCSNNCINYTDLSTNGTSWQWSFPGGTPGSSTLQNPQGICYSTPGTFNATLITSNGVGSDTITFVNHIHVLVSPPTPVITQSNDTLFCSTDPSYTAYQWYDSSAIIPGSTSAFLVINHSGNYNVAVHNENGCQISVGINVATGIKNYTFSNLFSLSPNPASTQLTIHTYSSFARSATISIINVLGQEVLSYPFSFGEGRDEAIDISNLSAGMYFLQLKTESVIDAKRFIKE